MVTTQAHKLCETESTKLGVNHVSLSVAFLGLQRLSVTGAITDKTLLCQDPDLINMQMLEETNTRCMRDDAHGCFCRHR